MSHFINKSILIVILIYNAQLSYGQSESLQDSLWQVWSDEELESDLRFDAIKNYASDLLWNNPKKSIRISNLFLSHATEIKDTTRMGEAHNLLGVANQLNGTLKISREHFIKSIDLYEATGDVYGSLMPKINLAHDLSNEPGKAVESINLFNNIDSLATANEYWEDAVTAKSGLIIFLLDLGKYGEALEQAGEMELIAKNPDIEIGPFAEYQFLTTLGDIYGILEQYDKTVKYYQQASKYNIETNSLIYACGDYLVIAEAQLAQKDTFAAKQSLDQAILYYSKIDHVEGLEAYKGEYSKFLMEYLNSNLDESNIYIDKTIDILEKNDGAFLFSSLYSYKGEIYLNKMDYSQAEKWYQKALTFAKSFEDPNQLELSLNGLYLCHKNQNNYKTALSYLDELTVVRDSLRSTSKTKKLAVLEAENNFNIERQATTYEHEAEIKREKDFHKNLLIGALGFLSILSLIFLTLFNRKKRKSAEREQQLQEEYTQQLLQSTEDERSRIAGDLHDSVNHQLLQLSKKTETGNPINKGELLSVMEQVRTISHNLHPAMFEQVGLEGSIEELCRNVMERTSIKIITQIDYNGKLSTKRELQIYRIIEEAMNNIIKHSQATNVIVTLSSHVDSLEVKVKDNGKGFNVKNQESGKAGFGLTNIRQRAKAIKGKINYTSSPSGTAMNLILNK